MSNESRVRLAVVGGGPAGLMAAEIARAAGVEVDLYEAKGSVGRKFLIAGKGGLNLTHSDPIERFVQRYPGRETEVARWLADFDAEALREWAQGLGVETFIGSSGRVFPKDFKAAPLLRSWVRRLRDAGVRFHVQHRWRGWSTDRHLRFDTPDGERCIHADAVVLALGGASWPQLGSDGTWVPWLEAQGIPVSPLQAANCGFDVDWSSHFSGRYAGHPVKPVVAHWRDAQGQPRRQQGELVISEYGLEGSLIYAIGTDLRQRIAVEGVAEISLDLAPGLEPARVEAELSRPRGGRSLSEWLRRQLRIEGVKAGLLYEGIDKAELAEPAVLSTRIKALPLRLLRPRPIAEAISSAGGVRLDALNDRLMVRGRPGLFCAGEMLDWEAPTGGYLLTACFATGRLAGQAAAAWLGST